AVSGRKTLHRHARREAAKNALDRDSPAEVPEARPPSAVGIGIVQRLELVAVLRTIGKDAVRVDGTDSDMVDEFSLPGLGFVGRHVGSGADARIEHEAPV